MPESPFLIAWKQKARALKVQTYALFFAYRDPRVPWYAKAFTALVVAYAFSPIDLIPDFIPVIGYADDLVLIPLGVYFAMKMIPPEIMAECRAQAEEQMRAGKPQFRFMVVVFVLVWIAAIALTGWIAYRLIAGR